MVADGGEGVFVGLFPLAGDVQGFPAEAVGGAVDTVLRPAEDAVGLGDVERDGRNVHDAAQWFPGTIIGETPTLGRGNVQRRFFENFWGVTGLDFREGGAFVGERVEEPRWRIGCRGRLR